MAFKASPSSQHQHCTDEAQKAETVSALVTFSFVICRFARMPSFQYPCSLVAQFSEEVYKNAGASDVLPLVMGSLDADKVRAVQFLRAGRVRVTFQDSQTCSQILEDGLDLGDVSVQLFPADERLRTVYIRDLPVEIEHEVVSNFLAEFGEVLSVGYCFFDHYPTIRNGNRVAKVLLDRDIPQYVEVNGCSCRVWYVRQPAQCSVCREFGHRAPACPLSGRCRRCHQPGHVARECTQAWGPLFPVSRSTDLSIETELPATTASVIVPVNTTSIADVAVSTAVITTAATVSTVPATVPSTSVNSSAAPVSTSCSTVTATAAATDSTCSVSTVASVPSTSDASSASVSKSKSPRPVISAKSFRTHLEKNYTSFEIPSFDNVTGKEWDSRARAYIKQQVQSMFVDKRIKLTNGDLVTWTELEVYECSLEISRILSFKNYLTDFIHTYVKSYWTNAKNVSKGKT